MPHQRHGVTYYTWPEVKELLVEGHRMFRRTTWYKKTFVCMADVRVPHIDHVVVRLMWRTDSEGVAGYKYIPQLADTIAEDWYEVTL